MQDGTKKLHFHIAFEGNGLPEWWTYNDLALMLAGDKFNPILRFMKEHNLEVAQPEVVKSKRKRGGAAPKDMQDLAELSGNDDIEAFGTGWLYGGSQYH